MAEPTASTLIKNEQELVLQGFRAILGDLRIPYAACPITGGPRYFAWLEAGGREGRADVIAANVRAAREEVSRLREVHGPIIDPTQIETVTPWAQRDFHALWREVFHRHVSSLILLRGWELSTGCLKEAQIAYRQGFPVMGRDLQPIALSDLVGRVEHAIEPLAAKGLPLSELAAELEFFRSKELL